MHCDGCVVDEQRLMQTFRERKKGVLRVMPSFDRIPLFSRLLSYLISIDLLSCSPALCLVEACTPRLLDSTFSLAWMVVSLVNPLSFALCGRYEQLEQERLEKLVQAFQDRMIDVSLAGMGFLLFMQGLLATRCAKRRTALEHVC